MSANTRPAGNDDLSPRARVALIYRAATLVAELLRYAEALESDLFTPEERDRFRELSGNGRVFALTEALRPLCSAEAHELNRARVAGVPLALINTRTGHTKTKIFAQVRPIRTTNRRKR